MRKCFFVILMVCLLPACHAPPGAAVRITRAPDAHTRTVMTLSGPVIGIQASVGQAYLGIPYARPPIGAMRWREPQPAAPWTVPRDATRLGPQCVQNYGPGAQLGEETHWLVVGNEDCLNLNIYTPADARPGAQKPVMVWVYGGSLVLGANRQYDLSVLAQRQDVVTVALNYRLGAFGFLAHPALRRQAGGAANLGLLDQQAALHWVQDNIAAFGGDPGNVTLFGESAGGWSVCAQLFAPGAAGLFQRAIIQSGPCNLVQSSVPVAQADAGGEQFASALGCGHDDSGACLRSLSRRQLSGAVAPSRGILGPHAWTFTAGDSVLPQSPRDALAHGDGVRIPVLIGTNADEGALFGLLLGKLGRLGSTDRVRRQMAETFDPSGADVAAAYEPEQLPDPKNAYAVAVTDGIFACPTLALASALAPRQPVWTYEFEDAKAPFLSLRPIGAYHAAEIVYVMQTRWQLANPAHFSSEQWALSDQMQRMWATFARTGSVAGQAVGSEVAGVSYAEGAGLGDAFARRHRCGFWRTPEPDPH